MVSCEEEAHGRCVRMCVRVCVRACVRASVCWCSLFGDPPGSEDHLHIADDDFYPSIISVYVTTTKQFVYHIAMDNV